MPSLSDRIDHLTATAKAISIAAAATTPSQDNSGPDTIPFTRAVLDTVLGDLIRDIDASELGLFTLVPAPDANVRKQPENGTRRGEISRVEFPGATPLRKQPARRDDMFRRKEYEPEAYAHAALKYLDRYQSIRRMPRARSQVVSMIEQLDETRENIKKMNETLQALTSAGAISDSAPMMSGVAEEEHQITDLQDRLKELRSQKDAILRSSESKPAPEPKAVSKLAPKLPLSPSSDPEDPEDEFWSTPAAPARTLRFTDRLLEEEPDFAELSAMTFDSPGPVPPKSVFARLAAGGSPTKKGLQNLPKGNTLGGPQDDDDGDDDDDDDDLDDLDDQTSLLDVRLDPEISIPNVTDVDVEGNDERTVILSKVPFEPPGKSQSFSSADHPPETIPPSAEVQPSVDLLSKSTKVRVTPELERIVARIWSTVGDVLLPDKGGEQLPGINKTLDLIESLATRSPSPSSPASSISSISSTATGPTPHQVNTARLLHALLTAPNQAMPLNQLKVAIGGTRALYACVAKKLIRIDRGGGEQIVLFDGC